jgi:hypothetical protein
VVHSSLNAWQMVGLNALQQAVNSDCYLSNVFCRISTLEYVVKLAHILQGMLEILKGVTYSSSCKRWLCLYCIFIVMFNEVQRIFTSFCIQTSVLSSRIGT